MMEYPFFQQQNTWDCSLTCIYMLHHYYHKTKVNYFTLIQQHNYFQDLNLLQVQKIASKLGVFLTSYLLKWTAFQTYKLTAPLIIQIVKNGKFHFIVVYKRKNNRFLIADPLAKNLQWIQLAELKVIYTGIVLTSQKTVFLHEKSHLTTFSLLFWQNMFFAMLTVLFLSILVTALTVSSQFLIKLIIDQVLLQKISHFMMTFLLGLIIVFFNKIILQTFLDFVILKIEINFKKKWNYKFLARIYQMNFVDYQKYKPAIILQNYAYFNEILDFYFPKSLYFFQTCFITLTSFILLLFINSTMILPVTFFAALNLLFYLLTLPWLRKNEHNEIQSQRQLQNYFLDFLKNYLSYKGRNLLVWKSNFLNDHFNAQFVAAWNKDKLLTVYELVNEGLNYLSTIFFLYLLFQNSVSSLQPGTFVFMFALISNILANSKVFLMNFSFWNRISQLKKRIWAFLNLSAMTDNQKSLFLPQIKQLHLINFNFSYDDYHQLWGQNITICLNKSVVFYGASGSGKTTLFLLLKRYLTGYKGEVLVNNNYRLESLNKDYFQNTVFFMQANTPVFQGTVFDNITNCQTPKAILSIWQKANINHFLQRINLTPSSQITNETISSGQRQIINFLSLFFRNESLFLLDESLNSVPLTWKRDLIHILLTFHADKTICYASHDQQIGDLFAKAITLNKNET